MVSILDDYVKEDCKSVPTSWAQRSGLGKEVEQKITKPHASNYTNFIQYELPYFV